MNYYQPKITVVLPWSYTTIIKSVQRQAKKRPDVGLGGDRLGLRVSATPQGFMDLGLARLSGEYSSPLVARLKDARIPVRRARTLHLPGYLSVAELQLNTDSRITKRLARHFCKSPGSDILICYDNQGHGHSQGRRVGQVVPAVRPGPMGLEGRSRVLAGRQDQVAGYADLVKAIRDVWEKSAEDFSQQIDWDNSDYEMYTTQDLVAGTLAEYLTPAQRERWENLESEIQTAILEAAFPEDKIKDTMARLERHFWNQSRGASSRPPATTVESRVDPLDMGLKRKVRFARLNQGGTIQQLFS